MRGEVNNISITSLILKRGHNTILDSKFKPKVSLNYRHLSTSKNKKDKIYETKDYTLLFLLILITVIMQYFIPLKTILYYYIMFILIYIIYLLLDLIILLLFISKKLLSPHISPFIFINYFKINF